ncbi:hypothetical protein EDC04DRAFT_2602018 [Pisolithus marmoratus]|nr:hypothetical protein EDC04DRAFT_2602018 [Pisolithus marmoratus]
MTDWQGSPPTRVPYHCQNCHESRSKAHHEQTHVVDVQSEYSDFSSQALDNFLGNINFFASTLPDQPVSRPSGTTHEPIPSGEATVATIENFRKSQFTSFPDQLSDFSRFFQTVRSFAILLMEEEYTDYNHMGADELMESETLQEMLSRLRTMQKKKGTAYPGGGM